MSIVVRKSHVEGEVKAPPSKSCTHRAMICASLADGRSRISTPLYCEDTMRTLDMCKKVGAEMTHGDPLIVEGTDTLSPSDGVMNCGGSGTTLRFFTAIAGAVPGISILTGDASLRRRPIAELLNALRALGVKTIAGRNRLPPLIVFGGIIRGGSTTLRGDVSSQFASALLLVSSKARNPVEITVTDLQSLPYVRITVDMLSRFGITVYERNNHFRIPPGQKLKPRKYTLEGDFSSAAFLLAAGALAGKVTVSNLTHTSIQGDRKIVEIFKEMGAHVTKKQDKITVEMGELSSTTVDIANTPDLAPIYALLGTQAKGVTKILNAGRLQWKESNRLTTITTELNKMGATIQKKEDELHIEGPTPLRGSVINPHRDHRIAMMGTVAGLVAEGKTTIEDEKCINKSYPQFFNDMKNIGADIS